MWYWIIATSCWVLACMLWYRHGRRVGWIQGFAVGIKAGFIGGKLHGRLTLDGQKDQNDPADWWKSDAE